MVTDNRNIDSISQLYRRIESITYHWKENDAYKEFILPISEYSNHEDMKNKALGIYNFHNATKSEQLIFQ